MSNFLQLLVRLLVCGYYGAFQTLRTPTELVKMYPCFYKNQDKDFKKEEVKQRACKEIAKELDLENDKVVEQLWKNLKKKLLSISLLSRKNFFSKSGDNISLMGMSWR